MNIVLSKRLNAILERLSECGQLADIGCDHGLLVCVAVLSGRAKKGIATDISAESLKKAETLIAEKELQQKIKCVQSDGFLNIEGLDDIDAVVISGMGGLEIVDILSKKRLLNARQYIFCPHTKQAELRKSLAGLGLMIVFDKKIKDGKKYYDIIEAVPASNPKSLDEYEIEFGLSNIANPDSVFMEFLNLEQERLAKILQKSYNYNIQYKLTMTNWLLKKEE